MISKIKDNKCLSATIFLFFAIMIFGTLLAPVIDFLIDKFVLIFTPFDYLFSLLVSASNYIFDLLTPLLASLYKFINLDIYLFPFLIKAFDFLYGYIIVFESSIMILGVFLLISKLKKFEAAFNKRKALLPKNHTDFMVMRALETKDPDEFFIKLSFLTLFTALFTIIALVNMSDISLLLENNILNIQDNNLNLISTENRGTIISMGSILHFSFFTFLFILFYGLIFPVFNQLIDGKFFVLSNDEVINMTHVPGDPKSISITNKHSE